jgi:hypothetical protein
MSKPEREQEMLAEAAYKILGDGAGCVIVYKRRGSGQRIVSNLQTSDTIRLLDHTVEGLRNKTVTLGEGTLEDEEDSNALS